MSEGGQKPQAADEASAQANPSDSKEHSADSSAAASRDGTKPQKEKHRVQWNRGGERWDTQNKRTTFELPSDGSSESEDGAKSPPKPRERIKTRRGTGPGERQAVESHAGMPSPPAPSATRLRPPILRKSSHSASGDSLAEKIKHVGHDAGVGGSEDEGDNPDILENAAGKAFSAQSAQQRAERLSRTIGTRSAPGSRLPSPIKRSTDPEKQSPPPSPTLNGQQPKFDLTAIPLEKLETRRNYGIHDEAGDGHDDRGEKPKRNKITHKFQSAANRLVKHHVERDPRKWFKFQRDESLLKSGQTTPIAERDPVDYVPPPREYREGVLGSLMKLYNDQNLGTALANFQFGGPETPNRSQNRLPSQSSGSALISPSSTPGTTPGTSISGSPGSPGSSGSGSPGGSFHKPKHQKWYHNHHHHSTGSIAELVSSSTSFAQPGGSLPGVAIKPKPKKQSLKDQAKDNVLRRGSRGSKNSDAIKIQIHLADTIQRKAYLLKICRALMSYGAPTHRLEEYMRMSARVLEIDSQFLYMPGCMVVSFGDAAWQTTDVRLVRCAQAVNLAKLYDTHTIYKEVVHDTIGVEEAIERLDEVKSRRDRYPHWFLVIVYGLASVSVGPFAFGARPIDLPIAFILGSLLGFMQLIMAPRSELYSNIFEISAAVLTSFLARAFGSISGASVFCFSSLAQSSIALILPGYTVLCGSLELQSKNIVAGSVRMVYAIIYSLFLGFGITIGTSIYGAIDPNATSATTCQTTWPFWWKVTFVLPFTLCLIIINQGTWRKTPPMLVLAMVGYLVNTYSAKRFAKNAQIAQTLGAVAIGVMANLYSRLRHGLAAAVLLPAIFVQVPSGLAASGSLISGVTSANQITNHSDASGTKGITTVSSGNEVSGGPGVQINSAVLNVGYSMIQIAIGITVGLFISALFVYPFGKRRSGLFSF